MKFEIFLVLLNVFGFGQLSKDRHGECGISAFEGIYGGSTVSRGDLPWMAHLEIQFPGPGRQTKSTCAGSLIYKNWVITAAHCLKKNDGTEAKQVTVNLGVVNFTKPLPYSPQRRTSSTFHFHHRFKYRQNVIDYDFALIKLDRAVVLNEHVRRLCLPDHRNNICTWPPRPTLGNDIRAHTVDGCSSVSAAGWGATEHGFLNSKDLLKVNLTIFNHSSCRTNGNDKICAGSPFRNVDTCVGDSGAPLMCDVAGRVYVVGLVSFGVDCGDPFQPGSYSRICRALRWIRKKTKDASKCPKKVNIENGQVRGSSVEHGANRTIRCDNGFYVHGNRRIQCKDKKWIQTGCCLSRRPLAGDQFIIDPDDIRSSCPTGTITTLSTTPEMLETTPTDEQSTRSRNERKPDSRMLTSTTTLPTTTIILCPEISPRDGARIRNGYVEAGGRTAGSKRTISCLPGFHTGTLWIVCQPNGQWSRHMPCVPLPTEQPGGPVEIRYPDNGLDYRNNENKCWKNIQVPKEYAIKFTLKEAQIESCCDGLYLYEGHQKNGRNGHLIQSQISGPVGREFYSTTNKATLCFRSNRQETDKGFRLTYEAFKGKAAVEEITDCETLRLGGNRKSQIYTIYPQGLGKPMQVFCEMEFFGGGWTVFHRRVDNSHQFNFRWSQYKLGFGYLDKNFWLGNDNIHSLTTSFGFPPAKYKLLIKMTSNNGETAYVHYNHFFIENEENKYRIHFSDTICDQTEAEDRFGIINHQPFTTVDRDNERNCSATYGGGTGWWFKDCDFVNLNANYGEHGILWHDFKGYPISDNGGRLKTVEMMTRRSEIDVCRDLKPNQKSKPTPTATPEFRVVTVPWPIIAAGWKIEPGFNILTITALVANSWVLKL